MLAIYNICINRELQFCIIKHFCVIDNMEFYRQHHTDIKLNQRVSTRITLGTMTAEIYMILMTRSYTAYLDAHMPKFSTYADHVTV